MNKSLIFAMLICFLTGCGDDVSAEAAIRYTNTWDRTKVNCSDIYTHDRSLVLMAFGQSNSANHIDVKYTPRNAVYNFFNGGCYVALDPLLGATGSSGSIWTRLADKILDNHPEYDNVIIVSAGVAGTAIHEWVAGTALNSYLILAHAQLLNNNIKLDAMLFAQGEADVVYGTLKYQYKYYFLNMLYNLRYYYNKAPIYVAQSSYCLGASSTQVTTAQLELANENTSIFHGPNTDLLIGSAYRDDDCHFSDYGAGVVSGLISEPGVDTWYNSLSPLLGVE